MKPLSVASALLGALLLTTLGACNEHSTAAATTADAQPAKRAAPSRGENVFRLQNHVMDDLITAQMSNPDLRAAERSDLAELESRLVDTCSSLNEAAGTSAMGDEPGMMLKLRVMVSLAGCERSATAARTFMENDRPLLGASLH
jgi:hypothetical protein